MKNRIHKSRCGRFYIDKCDVCSVLSDYGLNYNSKKETVDAILKHAKLLTPQQQGKLKIRFEKQCTEDGKQEERKEKNRIYRKTYCFFKGKTFKMISEYLEWCKNRFDHYKLGYDLWKQSGMKGYPAWGLSKISRKRVMIRKCEYFLVNKRCEKGCCECKED